MSLGKFSQYATYKRKRQPRKAPISIEIVNQRRGAVRARAVYNKDYDKLLVTLYEESREAQTRIEPFKSESLNVVVKRMPKQPKAIRENIAYIQAQQQEKERVLELAMMGKLTPAMLVVEMGKYV